MIWAAVGAGAVLVLLVTALAVVRSSGSKEPLILNKLTIDSTPEQGAEVLIAGEDRGPTPVTVEGLAPGKYEVVLRHSRYKRTIQEIEVKGLPEEQVTVEMQPLTGYLSIESSPIGAEVFLDGEKAGTTPLLSLPLQIGEHSYELRLENYYPLNNTFMVEENFRHEFTHQFKPMEAEIQVFSRPTGAQIWINNILQAQLSPAKFTLPPGSYLVSAHTQGFVQTEQTVELTENESETVELKMEPGNVPVGMVLVPGGDFAMGTDERAPDERPKRVVNLKPFYIDKFEVTNEAFVRIFPEHKFPDGQENFPALGVSWAQAVKYASMTGKRLPSEAEWEKAARGTDGREYPWGEMFENGRCNNQDSGLGRPVRVGKYFNGNSIYKCVDMSGNAYEWVMDWYDAYPGNQYVTKDYGQIFRVLRGGSYLSDKFEARCPARHFDRMDAKRADYGFRCAMDAP